MATSKGSDAIEMATFSRRQFMISACVLTAVQTLPTLLQSMLPWQTTQNEFITIYEISIHSLPKDVLTKGLRNQHFSQVLTKDLGSEWIKNYSLVRKNLENSGRLLKTAKFLSNDQTKIIFANLWRSEKDFKYFYEVANMAAMEELFASKQIVAALNSYISIEHKKVLA